MRLLHACSFVFRDFSLKTAPPYVITSHRWSEEEIRYQDITAKTNSNKAGYKKVEAFCKYVTSLQKTFRRGGCPDLEWIWIDTCCINKMDLTEVSESINSMFKWYENATLCIAYLSDVSDEADTPVEIFENLKQSVWWTRGWTLQELIAPRNVVLLNKAWRPIGHKSSSRAPDWFSVNAIGYPINPWISSISGIVEEIPDDHATHSKHMSVPEKLQWMNRRQTTKEEDFAYCQLGLFGVFMPLIYGEGKENAMNRLLCLVEQSSRSLKSPTTGLSLNLNTDAQLGTERTGTSLLKKPGTTHHRDRFKTPHNTSSDPAYGLPLVKVLTVAESAVSSSSWHLPYRFSRPSLLESSWPRDIQVKLPRGGYLSVKVNQAMTFGDLKQILSTPSYTGKKYDEQTLLDEYGLTEFRDQETVSARNVYKLSLQF